MFHKPNHGFQKTIVTTVELFWGENQKKKDSDYAYEAYNKALYFIDKREYEKALPYLEIAIKTDILSLKENVYSYIGFCNGELGNYIKAIEAYRQAIHIDPNNANAYYNLSVTYVHLGLYKDAIEARKQAIRIDPDRVICAIFHFNLGVAYGKLGLYKDEIEAYKQAIHIYPDHASAHCNLGVTYLMVGDINSALNEYKILKELDIDLANQLFDFIYVIYE